VHPREKKFPNVAKDGMAEIPQSLYEAMGNWELACNIIPHLRVAFQQSSKRGFRHFRVSPIKAFRESAIFKEIILRLLGFSPLDEQSLCH